MGDDWPDLPVLRRVGYPMAPANAAAACKAAAKFTSTRPGGSGAVREGVEWLLGILGRLDEAVRLYDRQG
jgi:3-deoxy-D-manno-octulosonate 8-phosphate phosphatase (KDO 8-P phosphatase)